MKETQVQAECAELYRLHGGFIYDLSQGYRPGTKKHATTRQTPGLADLWVFFPGPVYHFADHIPPTEPLPTSLWHEVKAMKSSSIQRAVAKDVGSWKRLIEDKLFRGAMNNPHLYHSAIGTIATERRLELYLKQRTPEQGLFAARCGMCAIPYVLGGLEEARAWVEVNLNGGKP